MKEATMKNLYTAQVTVTSGRDGAARSSDGHLDVRLGLPRELGGRGDAANPEQLFIAGYAACFASSVKAAAASLSVAVSQVRIDAQGTLAALDDGSYTVAHVRLAVQAEGLGDRAEAVLAEAKRICAYSNATRGNTVTDVILAR
jgi:lipoyl-dependent peroxiredoxin